MKAYREAFLAGDYKKAKETLEKTNLRNDEKSRLLWELELGTVDANLDDLDGAIRHFQSAIDLIDNLYTTKLSAKAASFLINDASDVFYGASYERSYAYYYLSRTYYARFLKTGKKGDLQGARAAILGWDTYFTEMQRSSSYKSLYHTDLMMKIFGGQIHEVSEVRNDQQIALQLYKDALKILDIEGGIFSLFNKTSNEYIKLYEENLKDGKGPPSKSFEKTSAYQDLKDFLVFKVLRLTKEIRPGDFNLQVKTLKANAELVKKVNEGERNVVLILEEGLIPAKVGKPFNFGIRGAMDSTESSSAKKMIATVGVEFITAFAMNQLGMMPTNTAGAGSFIFAHNMTRLAVQEAAVEFELPMIDSVPLVQRMEVYILDEKGVLVTHSPLPVISENGDIARVVLEEDVSARYVKTGTRVALKHLTAIIAALAVYQGLKAKTGQNGDFIAKAAAMGTYVASTKGIAMLEKADTRHWTTLPQAVRMTEFKLAPGKYQIGISHYSGDTVPATPSKLIGDIVVGKSVKSLHTINFFNQ